MQTGIGDGAAPFCVLPRAEKTEGKDMLDFITKINGAVNNFVWDVPAMALIMTGPPR